MKKVRKAEQQFHSSGWVLRLIALLFLLCFLTGVSKYCREGCGCMIHSKLLSFPSSLQLNWRKQTVGWRNCTDAFPTIILGHSWCHSGTLSVIWNMSSGGLLLVHMLIHLIQVILIVFKGADCLRCFLLKVSWEFLSYCSLQDGAEVSRAFGYDWYLKHTEPDSVPPVTLKSVGPSRKCDKERLV